MSTLQITINGRDYQIACDDGQEGRLTGLATFLDSRVQELKKGLGVVSDNMLLVLLSLMLADELQDAKGSKDMGEEELEDRVAEVIDAVAARVEKMVGRIREQANA